MENSSDWLNSPEILELRNELLDAPPRHQVIIGTANIENELLDLVTKRILAPSSSNLKRRAALGDGKIEFSELAIWAFRVGVVNELELRELRLIANIRNRFAHRPTAGLDFDAPQIRDWIDELKIPDIFEPTSEEAVPNPEFEIFRQAIRESREIRWTAALGGMLNKLHVRAQSIVKISQHVDSDSMK